MEGYIMCGPVTTKGDVANLKLKLCVRMTEPFRADISYLAPAGHPLFVVETISVS
jgi:hypothetical protein